MRECFAVFQGKSVTVFWRLVSFTVVRTLASYSAEPEWDCGYSDQMFERVSIAYFSPDRQIPGTVSQIKL